MVHMSLDACFSWLIFSHRPLNPGNQSPLKSGRMVHLRASSTEMLQEVCDSSDSQCSGSLLCSKLSQQDRGFEAHLFTDCF